ncbi:MAG: phage tail tape measure protein [Variovorax sp.]|nr:MAG: phage tail tape measure protein [Variovorax sp.]
MSALFFSFSQTDHTDMAAEKTTGILAGASMVTKEVPAATQALKDLSSAAGAANLAMGALRLDPRIRFGLKVARYMGESGLEGKREDASYSRAKTASGNYAGVTNDDLRRMEVDIARNTGGSRAKAAEALSSLVASGQVQARVLQEAATAVVQMNRVSGVSIKDGTEMFSQVADEPLKGSVKLNKGRNYLTPDDIKQIRDLESQGNNEAAVAAAQKALAVAMDRRARQEIEDMTPIDRGLLRFRELKELPRDLARNIGRGSTLREDYERASTKRDNRLRRDGGVGTSMAETPGGAVVGYPRRPASSTWDRDSERLRELQVSQARSAAAQGESASRGKVAADAAVEETEAIEQGKLTDEIARKVVAYQGGKTQSPLARGVSGNASKGRGAGTGIQRAEVDGLRTRIEVVCGCNEGPMDRAKPAMAADGSERTSVDPEEAHQAAQLESMRKSTSSVLDQTAALKARNEEQGKSQTVLQELGIAQLEQQYRDLEATDNVIPGYIDALSRRIDAEKNLLQVTRESEGIKSAEDKKKEQEGRSKKLSDDLNGTFKEGITGLMQGQEGAIDKMAESLKKKVSGALADALYDATLKPAVEKFTGWLSNSITGLFNGGGSGGGSGGGGGGGGNWFGSLVTSVLGFFGVGSAKGNVFSSPGLHAYSSSIVDRPTFFPFAKGIGLMGEAGAEAIMPLRRGTDGRLGVSLQGGGAAAQALHFAPSNVFYIDSRSDRGAVMADLDRVLQANNEGQMEQLKRMRVVPQ